MVYQIYGLGLVFEFHLGGSATILFKKKKCDIGLSKFVSMYSFNFFFNHCSIKPRRCHALSPSQLAVCQWLWWIRQDGLNWRTKQCTPDTVQEGTAQCAIQCLCTHTLSHARLKYMFQGVNHHNRWMWITCHFFSTISSPHPDFLKAARSQDTMISYYNIMPWLCH